MKKITENALLYRVNQLREKMAMFEAGAMGQGSQGLTPAEIEKNVEIRHKAEADAQKTAANTQTNTQTNQPFPGYKPVDPTQTTTPPAGNTAPPPAGNTAPPPAGNTTTPPPAPPPKTPPTTTPAAPEGWWDRAMGAADHFIGSTAADIMNTGDNIAKAYHDTRNQPTAGTQGQQKVGANQGGGAFPKTPDEIKAFQNANGLAPDGKIGVNTMAKLKEKGVAIPQGFQPVANRQHPAAPAGTAAKPVAGSKPVAGAAPVAGQVMPNGSVSSGDADRDERLAQFGQVAQMTPDQQHSFYMGTAAQDAKSAGHPMDPASVARAAQPYGTTPAPATNKAPVGGQMQSTGDPVKDSELSKQGNTIVYKEDQDLARIVQLARW